MAIQAAWSRPGNPSGSNLSQASQRALRGVVEGRGKQWAAAGTHGPPGVPVHVQVRSTGIGSGWVFGVDLTNFSGFQTNPEDPSEDFRARFCANPQPKGRKLHGVQARKPDVSNNPTCLGDSQIPQALRV